MDTHIRLLFVDSEQVEYLLIGSLLSEIFHTAYEITWLAQLDLALPEILSDNYDVILMNYQWGEHTAKDLIKAARHQGAKAPILVMTDEMEADVDREALSVGAADYLIKGKIDAQLLERTMRYAIERKANETRLSELAHYDPLTGVSNRALFKDRLHHAVDLARRGGHTFTLMYLDLDGFKPVNDCYGHDVGDLLIKQAAQRLQECVRTSDTVARVGGDEFVLLLDDMRSSTDMAHLAGKVIEALASPFEINGMEITVGCSLGIAPYRSGALADDIQRQADMAMYRAKQANGNQYCFYAESMDEDARRQIAIEHELRRGLGRGEMAVYYQPRLDTITGEICALEALVRWRHPARGLLAPSEFLDVAESSGLIVDMGYQVLAQVCQDAHALAKAGLAETPLCLNLSLRQLRDERLVDALIQQLDAAGIRGSRLEFEVSEACLMKEPRAVGEAMGLLSVTGASFALDDFGSAMSSLPVIQQLPFERLKIDPQLVAGVATDRAKHALVMAVVQLAHSLKLSTVAEGVETGDQLRRLRELGCDEVQGFWLCAPKPLAEILTHLQQAQAQLDA
ncbi:EAL domain-containing protein [Simiduia sp. 21SJ11W-1]|uniref:putative bifunctional diguanylate cyclase/phosphodiesterase n=1 Tax=Simiduia sp. 21SJ11W-1 TaxID=2909669 RepID=UPI00209CA9E9|nr:EAL domain-containing protein [Simiduia sp. 21SJ11W-1]UTA48062.1 EAL domain-containing protein [Simiduia sp. 21SJ11W-1]